MFLSTISICGEIQKYSAAAERRKLSQLHREKCVPQPIGNPFLIFKHWTGTVAEDLITEVPTGKILKLNLTFKASSSGNKRLRRSILRAASNGFKIIIDH